LEIKKLLILKGITQTMILIIITIKIVVPVMEQIQTQIITSIIAIKSLS